tara:strand:+ start:1771 stop:2133 length:363 start_codon:yes stop_codon:yes gene_type:complete
MMEKHRGFPGRLAGTDFQFTIRRASKKGPSRIIRRERYADRRPSDRRADEAFLHALIQHFGNAPFERGNLDSGRLSWLFDREVLPADEDFDPESYEARLRVDMVKAQSTFAQIFENGWSA